MTEAVAYNSFPISAGADIDLDLSIIDSADAAVDLTNATLRFLATETNSGTAVLDSASSPQTATITVTDATGGLATVSLADDDTASLLGDYYYEVKVTDVTGIESVTNRGIITVEASVT